jgi:hypothetical protein
MKKDKLSDIEVERVNGGSVKRREKGENGRKMERKI